MMSSIDDGEVLAGLAFLSRYARAEFKPALEFAASACLQIRAQDKVTRLRLRPTDDLELSVRSLNALASLELNTIGDVEKFFCQSDDAFLLHSSHFTKKCFKEVRQVLKNIGLEVR
jgi:DNA-directed RNA polymerase alpha subunit